MFMYQDALLLPQQYLNNLEEVANFDDLPIPAPVPAGKQMFSCNLHKFVNMNGMASKSYSKILSHVMR